MREQCEKCGNLLVAPCGPANSPMLIIGEFPGVDEQRQGIPWVGKAGEVLRKELLRAGAPITEIRMTNIWLHVPNDRCDIDWHIKQMKKELRRKKAILLLGSDVTMLFLGEKVSFVTGTFVDSELFPASVVGAIACYNPAIALQGGGIGEVRLAIERFARLCEEVT